jgi:hypothetical protein
MKLPFAFGAYFYTTLVLSNFYHLYIGTKITRKLMPPQQSYKTSDRNMHYKWMVSSIIFFFAKECHPPYYSNLDEKILTNSPSLS